MNVHTRNWLARWPWWLLIILRELPESGDAYLGEMVLPCMGGALSLSVPLLLLLVIPEIRSLWYVVVGCGVLLYLLIGAGAYFGCSRSTGEHWQYGGVW